MIAPPQVQAQSFARAIRTDITTTFLLKQQPVGPSVRSNAICDDRRPDVQKCCNPVNLDFALSFVSLPQELESEVVNVP
jgi:hypothetical protein